MKGIKIKVDRIGQSLLALLTVMLMIQGCKTGRTEIVNMQCEYQNYPIGIDTHSPRFTWNYAGDTTWQQSACRLILADSPKGLKRKGEGFRWESPITQSSQMLTVYTGSNPLKPHSTYYWQIEANGADGRKCALSPVATFETAKMIPTDWVAHWITDGQERTQHVAPLLRRTFEVKGRIAQARLYVSAAAYVKLELNGHRLSSTSLNPGYTHYDRRNLYCSFVSGSEYPHGCPRQRVLQ